MPTLSPDDPGYSVRLFPKMPSAPTQGLTPLPFGDVS
jgi:hypothetical protein